MSAQAPRVLVVEDEEAIAQGLVFNLERKGYVAELARDGREALERLSVPRYDLIVLDVRLPEVDGFEVCQRLRRDGDTTPILMLTASRSTSPSSWRASRACCDARRGRGRPLPQPSRAPRRTPARATSSASTGSTSTRTRRRRAEASYSSPRRSFR